jgi:dihydroorotase
LPFKCDLQRYSAGVFSAHAALPFYAMAFEKEGKLDQLEAFASHNGGAIQAESS